MKKMILDDFIKYAKEQFDCDILLKSKDNPDTFESIFGASEEFKKRKRIYSYVKTRTKRKRVY